MATNSGVGEAEGDPDGAKLGPRLEAFVGELLGGTDKVGELDGSCVLVGVVDGELVGVFVGDFVGGDVDGEKDGAGLVVGDGVFSSVGLCDTDGDAERVGVADGIGVMRTDGDDEGRAVTTGPNGSI